MERVRDEIKKVVCACIDYHRVCNEYHQKWSKPLALANDLMVGEMVTKQVAI